MSFLNKAKQAAEQAATRAREGVEDAQQKRELSQAYGDLGRKTFELLESGEISHAGLEPTAAQIRTLQEKISEAPAADAAVDPSQPPAMPT